jgi:large subunit ribosomal protein L6
MRGNIIKIPKNNTVLYNEQKNILIILGKKNKKYIKMTNKLVCEHKSLKIIKDCYNGKSESDISTKKSLNKLFLNIKNCFLETNTIFYKKLKFIGIGYRADNFKNSSVSKNKALNVKLGLSHPLFMSNCNFNLNIFVYKLTKLFLFGNSYFSITQISAAIRSIKKPEPYKGKGILYEGEKIKIKKGKKV